MPMNRHTSSPPTLIMKLIPIINATSVKRVILETAHKAHILKFVVLVESPHKHIGNKRMEDTI
jgi:hypothetical protein